MLRYRRYRVFLFFAIVCVVAFYKFSSSDSSWKEGLTRAAGAGTKSGEKEIVNSPNPKPQVALETKKFEVEIPAAHTSRVLRPPPPISTVTDPADIRSQLAPWRPVQTPAPPPTIPKPFGDKRPPYNVGPNHPDQDGNGKGRVEIEPLPTSIEAIYWKKQPEHFPVSSTIQLPTGSPKPIPKIQFDFKKESPAEKAAREIKLNIIQGVFNRSWTGYKEHAWMQDELSPVSGGSRNPFASWGATLVDALDTLWIMGLKDEFEEAVKAVKKIDFMTSPRPDIPLFETTIRYLGGLLAAYDMAGNKHRVLLDKAVELAEILMGAFDTPNRMPQTYYYWRP